MYTLCYFGNSHKSQHRHCRGNLIFSLPNIFNNIPRNIVYDFNQGMIPCAGLMKNKYNLLMWKFKTSEISDTLNITKMKTKLNIIMIKLV